jgi:hypothetical protein
METSMPFFVKQAWLSVAVALCACGSTETSNAPPPPEGVSFSVDGQTVAVTRTRFADDDGATTIRNTVDILGATRLDISPGIGTGQKSCAEASVAIFHPRDGNDLHTDKDDPTCTVNVTYNGESNLLAGSFEGDLVSLNKDKRHRVSLTWSVRP